MNSYSWSMQICLLYIQVSFGEQDGGEAGTPNTRPFVQPMSRWGILEYLRTARDVM